MDRTGTGKVVRDREGLQLIIERRLAGTADEVWRSLTAARQLKKWLGSHSITRSEPGSRFATQTLADGQPRLSEFSLAELGPVTLLFFSQRVSDWRQAGVVGPQWEYNLDRLAAGFSGSALPKLDEYETQRPYYERLAMDGEPSTAR